MQFPKNHIINNSQINLWNVNKMQCYLKYFIDDEDLQIKGFRNSSMDKGSAVHNYIDKKEPSNLLQQNETDFLDQLIKHLGLDKIDREQHKKRKIREGLYAGGTLDGVSKDGTTLYEYKTGVDEGILRKKPIKEQIEYYLFLSQRIFQVNKIWIGTEKSNYGLKLSGKYAIKKERYSPIERQNMYRNVMKRIDFFIRDVENWELPSGEVVNNKAEF